MWQEYFGGNISIVNLKRRIDRLENSTTVLNDLGIIFEVWEATENSDKPILGLVDSMQRYFKKVLAGGGKRCLVFEDDIKELVDTKTFNDTMNKCVEQLPEDWGLFYPGCNVAHGVDKFYSENLLSLKMAFATHSVAYSKKAMEFVVNREIKEPFDNCLVRDFQPHAKVFCSYPMLFTQMADFSDIEQKNTDYSRFIEGRYNEAIKRLFHESQ